MSLQPESALLQRIDAALPQTQCTRCGYPDCHRYAQALASGATDIDQCPPGGQEGVQRLAAILGRAPRPLNPAHGSAGPMTAAVIDENWCIGCTLCLKACPTDAILGANKRMHTVLTHYCTGCDLCLPVCPVDCISMVNVSGVRTGWDAWSPALAQQARQRYEQRARRLQREAADRSESHPAQAQHQPEHLAAPSKHSDPAMLDKKRAVIEAALARARAART